MAFQNPRGCEDVLPTDSHRWLHVERVFRELTARYGFQEIRTPTFEDLEVFTRSAGDTSDIVTKQMYEFEDKGGRRVCLKPEGTAGIARAIVQHNLCPPGSIARLSYVIPIFRYERPQKGRLREAHQVGLELVGSPSPTADAEVIEITVRFYQALGVQDARVSLNSIGRSACRDRYRAVVLEHIKGYLADQDSETQAKIHKNPLRALDSKDPKAQEALVGLPPILDFLEDASKANFDRLRALLDEAAIPYRVDSSIVRGLDYYTDTVFEVTSNLLGSQSALCGGGRYDDLIMQLGGAPTPSVGVAMGIERALIVMQAIGVEPESSRPKAFVVGADPSAESACRDIVRRLRGAGIATMSDLDARSMKSQLRQADRSSARYAIIVGGDELARGVVQLRDLAKGDQREVPNDASLVAELA